jgi:hypothetical protein
MRTYLQLGTLLGAFLGWIAGRPGSGDLSGAIAALPIGATLLCLGWMNLSHQAVALTALGGVALGYGVAFLVRRWRRK